MVFANCTALIPDDISYGCSIFGPIYLPPKKKSRLASTAAWHYASTASGREQKASTNRTWSETIYGYCFFHL